MRIRPFAPPIRPWMALSLIACMTALGSGLTQAAPSPPGPPQAPLPALPAAGPVPQSIAWTFGVVLPSQDPAGLASYAQALSTPGSPLYHHFLSHQALMAQYGPSASLESTVASTLQQEGLTVTPIGQVLEVQGTVGQVNTLFNTTLTHFAPGPHAFIAPSGPVVLPSRLAGAVGVIGLTANTLHPLATEQAASPLDEVQVGPSPAQPGSVSTATATATSPSGALRVTAERLSDGPRTPGLAVRYQISATLDGTPDPTATFAGLAGPVTGAPSFIDPSPTNGAGQFLLSFTASQAQNLNLTLTVTDSAGHTVHVPLPTAVFQGPSVATCDAAPLFPGDTGSVLCPFNPASNSINQVYGAAPLAALPAQKGPVAIAVYSEGAPNSVLPGATADANRFAQTFGLPAPSILAAYSGPNACTAVVCGSGAMQGIQLELTLDSQMLETASPGATVEVYGAGSLRSALNQVVTQDTARVFSISYGAGELVEATYEPGAQAVWDLLAEEANLEGITLVSAAGDSGAFEGVRYGSGTPQVNYPANSPYVTAVGGTEAAVSPTGHLLESALWGGNLGQELSTSDLLSFLSLTNMMGGGGISALEPTPLYQRIATGISLTGRGTPDVSLPASAVTPGYYGIFDGAPALFGGTSAATPILAGWLADLSLATGPLGNVNPALYGIAAQDPQAFFPVTYGSNGVESVTPMYSAVTGLGSPDVSAILADLSQPLGAAGPTGPTGPMPSGNQPGRMAPPPAGPGPGPGNGPPSHR